MNKDSYLYSIHKSMKGEISLIKETNKESRKSDLLTIVTSLIIFSLMVAYTIFFKHSWIAELGLVVYILIKMTYFIKGKSTKMTKSELLQKLEEELND